MESFHPGVLFVLGVGVFGGILGAWLFQRLRIPQVVGYIVIGLIVGQSGLKLITAQAVSSLQLLTLFAVGIIGFLVGGELEGSTFRKYGKQFTAIMIGEGMGAFVLVGLASGVVVYLVTRSMQAALASGVVLGAISSATDPASTIEVLYEYRSRGMLTLALIAVVALDDALAMSLYGFGTTAAGMIAGEASSFSDAARKIGIELLGSVGLGVAAGLVLNLILRYMGQPEKALALAIGTILLVIATAATFDMDVILATMAMGATLVNVAPVRSKELFTVVRNFATPIYVIFFVFVGARLALPKMPYWLWIIVGLYVFFRTLGKMAGTYFTARMTRAHPSVQRYGGLGLFAQGGVAVGLSIMAGQHLQNIQVMPGLALGDMIVYAVTATTLIVQVIGPPMVKLAIRLADEIGRNVTEDDVIKTLIVRDMLSEGVVCVSQEEPVKVVIERYSETDQVVYPVIGAEGRLVGMITLEGMKAVIARHQMWEWLVAADVMYPARRVVTTATPLKDALDMMSQMRVEQIPVVEDETRLTPVGVLDSRRVMRIVEEETLRRQQSQSAHDVDGAQTATV